MTISRGLLSFLIAILFAVLAVVFAGKWLKQSGAEVAHVVMATQEIGLGQKIESSHIQLVEWPASMVPSNAIKTTGKLAGRVVKSTVAMGEVLLYSKLAPEGESGGLSAVIHEGKRAITVKVNEVMGVAGFALPGNFVDIVVNAKEDSQTANHAQVSISKIVLQHILVLAVGEETSRDDTKPKKVNAVTLEVTPEQAEKIDLARSVGELSLVLRNQSDIVESPTHGITVTSLLDKQEQKEPEVIMPTTVEPRPIVKKAAPKPQPVLRAKECVKVLSGTQERTECF